MPFDIFFPLERRCTPSLLHDRPMVGPPRSLSIGVSVAIPPRSLTSDMCSYERGGKWSTVTHRYPHPCMKFNGWCSGAPLRRNTIQSYCARQFVQVEGSHQLPSHSATAVDGERCAGACACRVICGLQWQWQCSGNPPNIERVKRVKGPESPPPGRVGHFRSQDSLSSTQPMCKINQPRAISH